jgi:hypothetical protein
MRRTAFTSENSRSERNTERRCDPSGRWAPTNIRRVYVDDSKKPGTLWIGSNRGASIVKVEPLD